MRKPSRAKGAAEEVRELYDLCLLTYSFDISVELLVELSFELFCEVCFDIVLVFIQSLWTR